MITEAKSDFSEIVGYDGVYLINRYGVVKSVDRVEKWNGFIRKRKGRTLKGCFDRYGYPCVKLCKEGKLNHHTVHRLVALTFIPNPKSLPQVNHKDGNKSNNHISNLEWCTASQNVIHSHKNNLCSPSRGKYHYGSKPVIAIQDTAILEFCSLTECANYLSVSKQAIRQSIKLNNKSKGHIISYL